MKTAQQADFQAFQDATQTDPPQYAGQAAGMPLTDGIDSVRPGPAPGLPNRLSDPNPTQQASIMSGTSPVTVGGYAAVTSPPWIYSAYPVTNDEDATSAWFLDYVNDSHVELIAPLELAPAWTP